MNKVITIDGPSASGKGTLAILLAERLNWKISGVLIGSSWVFYLLWSGSMPLPIRYMPQFIS